MNSWPNFSRYDSFAAGQKHVVIDIALAGVFKPNVNTVEAGDLLVVGLPVVLQMLPFPLSPRLGRGIVGAGGLAPEGINLLEVIVDGVDRVHQPSINLFTSTHVSKHAYN